jgi:N-acetyl sugar amidotransferase
MSFSKDDTAEFIKDLNNLKICKRCIYDELVPGISFNEEGICNYCEMIDRLQEEYQTGLPEGKRKYESIVEEIRKAGKGKKYDCIVGVSGGTDSSFMIYQAVKEYGLRVLAVHYDNTWNSAIATENIRKVLGKLNVDLYTYVVDNKEVDDIFKSFFKASVPELDASTDIAVAEILYRACAKYKVRYILEGHSFRTEGVSPLGLMYADGKYIQDIQKKFGSKKIKTYPNMSILSFLKWISIYRIKKIRPLWYLDYSKEEARAILEKEFGWEYYGGHHLENRITAFHHSFYDTRKFNIDNRNNSLSASVRSNLISREDALKEYQKPPILEPEILDYLKKRLGFTDDEFEAVMNLPIRSYLNYKTYKPAFQLMKPYFWIMLKFNLIPKSFYLKYVCKKGI